MRRGILAVAVLLSAAAGLAEADYMVIVANLGQPKDQPANNGGMPGMPGMPGGGFPGGFRGGMPGGGFPGGGFPGGGRGSGFPGGSGMGRPGGPGMPGMPGMGGSGRGMMGGPGMFGGGSSEVDVDELPYIVVGIVEINPIRSLKAYDKYGAPLRVSGKGWHATLFKNLPNVEVFFLTEGNNPVPTVHKQFEDRRAEAFRGKPTAEGLIELARWALGHGLVKECAQVMEEAAKANKDNPAVVAFQKVKADLDKPLPADNPAGAWGQLLRGDAVTTTPQHHYAVMHSGNANPAEVKGRLDRLEDSCRSFYYWFALQGQALPVPAQHLPAVLTTKEDNFKRLHNVFDSGPVVMDGFLGRRENVVVLSATRRDETYTTLSTVSASDFWSQGYNRYEILKGVKSAVPLAQRADVHRTAQAQAFALLLKALEDESVLGSTSHDVARQMLFAAGLLPRNVAAPEWLQFGVGSFFEVPQESPWPTIGFPNFYYTPRIKELKNKGKLDRLPYNELEKVVTDTYFRAGGKDKDASVRKGRAASWSLVYFLAYHKPAELKRYFKELSKMPRDMELTHDMLRDCFARAFDAVNPDGSVNKEKLNRVANEWYSSIGSVRLESEDIHAKISKYFEDARKQNAGPPSDGQQNNPGGGPNQPGGGRGGRNPFQGS